MISDSERLRRCFRAQGRHLLETDPACLDFPTLVRQTLATRPPDFGVSYVTATCKVRALLHLPPDRRGGTSPRRRFWAELCERVEMRLAARPDQSLPRAVQHVLTRERPSRWHLSYATACKWLEDAGH